MIRLVLAFLLLSAGFAHAKQTEIVPYGCMKVLAPYSSTMVCENHFTNAGQMQVQVNDSDMYVGASTNWPIYVNTGAGSYPSSVTVSVSGGAPIYLTPDYAGNWTGSFPTGNANGPLVIYVVANPGNGYAYKLEARETLFVTGGADYAQPAPKGAAGMHQQDGDEFVTLSGEVCKPGTGNYPNCTMGSASDGARWFLDRPCVKTGCDYGDAYWGHPGDPYNPYSIISDPANNNANRFLRMRSVFSTASVDLNGYNRLWTGAQMSTAFPDGTTNFKLPPANTPFYVEARVLLPYGYAAPGSGGCWPAFWATTINGQLGAPGDVEIDAFEYHCAGYANVTAGEHAYGTAVNVNPPYYNGQPLPPVGTAQDLTTAFHRWGVLVDPVKSTVTWYLDDAVFSTGGLDKLAGGTPMNFYWMLTAAYGSGFPDWPPPSYYHDFIVDYYHIWW